ncbi:MAG: hypothetical protein PVH61_20200 [Candidatus Aminicenantes bacterium]|jgi:hypothetical protein
MATFTKNYVEATPNTPILSSAWNENVYSTQERFQHHEHDGSGENGPQIGLSGLKTEVTDILTSSAGYEARITDLEAQIAELRKPAVISLSANTGSVGANIIIRGINFVAPVRVFFGSVEVPGGEAELMTNTTIRASVQTGGDGRVRVETDFGSASSAESFVVVP